MNVLYKGDTPLATIAPEVVDNLTTNDSTKALSAKQGKVLNDKIDSITELYKTENINEPTFTVNSLAYVDKSILIPAKSGYKPVGVVRWLLRSAFAVLVKADLSFSNNNYYLDITIGNPTTSAISPFPQFTILYIKDI